MLWILVIEMLTIMIKMRDLLMMLRGSMLEQGQGVDIRGANSKYLKTVVQRSMMVRVDR